MQLIKIFVATLVGSIIGTYLGIFAAKLVYRMKNK